MRLVLNLCILIIFSGCTKSIIQNHNDSFVESSSDNQIIDENDCSGIINQYLFVIEDAKNFYRDDHTISNNITINTLIKCGLDSNFIIRKRVQLALLNYCETFIKYETEDNGHPTIFNRESNIGKILTSINTIECFNIHLKIFSYNDCVGHEPGMEQSTGTAYFEYMMLPLISTIDGRPAYEFYKEYKFEFYFGDIRDDCGLYFYNKLFYFIKKSWDEGKIVLKTDDTH